jgi:glyoxylase-like metal-dependent hydrolase (beta-lactamase superfamily II)
MNTLESQLDYCLGTAVPGPGLAFDVAPGIKWVRMALPFALNHINLWLLRDSLPGEGGAPARQGWAIVDCGIDSPATRAAWEQVFASALDGLPVLRVIVTHMHPDHIGAAHWLCERWNVRLWISATDFGIARMASSASAGFGGPLSAAFMAVHGMAADPAAVDGVASRTNYYRNLVPAVPSAYRRLLDGKVLAIGDGDATAEWTCRVGYGHAPEHIALECASKRILISGDMVLPRISTNVSVVDVEPEADPLTLYLDSIGRMRAIDADTLVLPSHGLPFKGLHTRIDQLQAHHAERFAEVLEACAVRPRTAFELVPLLFKRKLDLHQMTFAMGESVAHCHALWFAGRLARHVGGDGVIRFAAA